MFTETALASLAAGEAAINETAAEAVITAAELDSGTKELMAFLNDAAIPKADVFTDFENIAGPVNPYLDRNALERTLSAGTKGEFTLEALEATELEEDADLTELSEQDAVNALTPEQANLKVGRSPVPPLRGSYTAQLSRLSERAAVALKNAALRRNGEAALAGDLSQAEKMQQTAELLDEISHVSDMAGDYLGIASYPEFMVRHSPNSK